MQIKNVHFKTIDSTNNWAKAQTQQLDKTALTVITADEQTAGRGRFKRSWVSPPGNLIATFVFFIEHLDDKIGNLPQILSLAAIEALFPHHVEIKWPNDLVMGGKKLAGILSEITECEGRWAMILGIGINLNLPKDELVKIDRPATSILEETGKSLEVPPLMENLSRAFHQKLLLFQAQGFAPFYDDYCRALVHKTGEKIRFSNFQHVIEGVFEEINQDGSLSLRLPEGNILRCTTGELV